MDDLYYAVLILPNALLQRYSFPCRKIHIPTDGIHRKLKISSS